MHSRDVGNILSEIDPARLQGYLGAVEGVRHGTENYALLDETAHYLETTFRSFGLGVTHQEVFFKGRPYRNIIATLEGSAPEKDRLLIGAHYDSPRGSPGADDNGSGTAVLLEAARILSRHRPARTVQFVAFTLEEPQTWTHVILRGSRQFAREARKEGIGYAAAVILECVGYTDTRVRSRLIPLLVGVRVSEAADFLAVIADRRSAGIMDLFHTTAAATVPELTVVPYAVPLSGYIIPQTRFSDHASYWDQGYPALMLTDTAMFRNPHYHTSRDTSDTLDVEFMAAVTRSVVAFILKLGSGEGE